MNEKAIEEYINYAIDGIIALSEEWPDEAKKDVVAIKKVLTQALAALKPAVCKLCGGTGTKIVHNDFGAVIHQASGKCPDCKPPVCKFHKTCGDRKNCNGRGMIDRPAWDVSAPNDGKDIPCPDYDPVVCKPPTSKPAVCETCEGHKEVIDVEKTNSTKIITTKPCPVCKPPTEQARAETLIDPLAGADTAKFVRNVRDALEVMDVHGKFHRKIMEKALDHIDRNT